MSERLPDFLVIGAMKAGTTTLYADLTAHPGLYLPPEKEPEDLIHARTETPRGRAAYGAKFRAAPARAFLGEASTAYAKRPTHEGVAARAVRLCGPGLKVIYVVRDPVARALSHYRHQVGLGLEARPLCRALAEDPVYAAYSRYDWQLAPWRAALPEAQILVLPFAVYMADRSAGLARACAFLGVAPVPAGQGARNASTGKRVTRPGGLMRRVATSPAYLYRVKPWLPRVVRAGAKAVLLPRAPEIETRLTEADRTAFLDALKGDALALSVLREGRA